MGKQSNSVESAMDDPSGHFAKRQRPKLSQLQRTVSGVTVGLNKRVGLAPEESHPGPNSSKLAARWKMEF
jgi:hypothetical protein